MHYGNGEIHYGNGETQCGEMGPMRERSDPIGNIQAQQGIYRFNGEHTHPIMVSRDPMAECEDRAMDLCRRGIVEVEWCFCFTF